MTVPTQSPVVNSDLEHSTQMTQRGLCRSIKVWRKSWKCSWRHIPSLWVPLPAAKLSFLDAWATGPGALKQSAGGTDNYRKWSLWVCVCVCNALGSHSSRHHKVTYHCSYRTKNPVIIFDICICTCVCVCVCVHCSFSKSKPQCTLGTETLQCVWPRYCCDANTGPMSDVIIRPQWLSALEHGALCRHDIVISIIGKEISLRSKLCVLGVQPDHFIVALQQLILDFYKPGK